MSVEHDLALVRRARVGDREALDQLVRLHQDRVYALALGIVGPDDAADVMQETFVALVRHLDSFREDSLFSTWLHRVTVRKAYDHLRRRVPEPVDPAGWVVAEAPSTTDEIERGMAGEDLLEAIRALDDGFREAVMLVDVLGCSIEEAAMAMEVAPGTAKSRVFRGRAALAKRLGTLGYDPASKVRER